MLERWLPLTALCAAQAGAAWLLVRAQPGSLWVPGDLEAQVVAAAWIAAALALGWLVAVTVAALVVQVAGVGGRAGRAVAAVTPRVVQAVARRTVAASTAVVVSTSPAMAVADSGPPRVPIGGITTSDVVPPGAGGILDEVALPPTGAAGAADDPPAGQPVVDPGGGTDPGMGSDSEEIVAPPPGADPPGGDGTGEVGGPETTEHDGPGSSDAQSDAGQARTHRVQAGEHLWGLARTRLAAAGRPVDDRSVHAYWVRVVDANDTLASGDPDVIHPGEVVVLPALPGD